MKWDLFLCKIFFKPKCRKIGFFEFIFFVLNWHLTKSLEGRFGKNVRHDGNTEISSTRAQKSSCHSIMSRSKMLSRPELNTKNTLFVTTQMLYSCHTPRTDQLRLYLIQLMFAHTTSKCMSDVQTYHML